MKFTKNIYHNISLYLQEIDLTNFGSICKNSTFILHKYKIKIMLYTFNKVTILLYNKNNQVFSSVTYNSFNLSNFINKNKSIKKIIIEFNDIGYNNIETLNSLASSYFNYFSIDKMTFNNEMPKRVFFFDRNQFIGNQFILSHSNCIKYYNSIIQFCNGLSNFNKFILYDISEYSCVNGINLIYENYSKIPDFILANNFIKNNNEIKCVFHNATINKLKSYTIIGIIAFDNDLKNISNISSLKFLELCGSFFKKEIFLPNNLETLILDDFTGNLNTICKAIIKLENLKKLYIQKFSPLLYNIATNLTHLNICEAVNNFKINLFKNLEYLLINLENSVLDLSKHNIQTLFLKCNKVCIYFNQEITYKYINLHIYQTKTEYNNFKTDILAYTNLVEYIDRSLTDCEVNKLIINESSVSKIINFPKRLTEIKLDCMNNYSFSDFPDSIEKLYIKIYNCNLHKQGLFPKNIKELTICEFDNISSTKKRIFFGSFILKAKNLSKFITKITTNPIYYPIGNINTSYINKRGWKCIIYNKNY